MYRDFALHVGIPARKVLLKVLGRYTVGPVRRGGMAGRHAPQTAHSQSSRIL
jgi:hypothetical protein